MSRINEVINRLELAAKRIGVSIEEAVEILEGKHPDQVVVPAKFASDLGIPAEEGTVRVFVPPVVAANPPASEIPPQADHATDSQGADETLPSGSTAE